MARYSVLIVLTSGRQVAAERDGATPREAAEKVLKDKCPEADPRNVSATICRLIPDPPLGGYTGANLSEADRLRLSLR